MKLNLILFNIVVFIAVLVLALGAVHDSWTVFWFGVAIFFLGLVAFIIDEFRDYRPLPKHILGRDVKDF